MPWSIDARVPVRLGALTDAGEGDALLIEGNVDAAGWPATRFEAVSPGHGPECACCAPRSSAALALNTLFQARARGDLPFFRRVIAVTASPEGDMAVWTALRSDPLIVGRYRLEDG